MKICISMIYFEGGMGCIASQSLKKFKKIHEIHKNQKICDIS